MKKRRKVWSTRKPRPVNVAPGKPPPEPTPAEAALCKLLDEDREYLRHSDPMREE